jgi:hypothetical protein
MYQGVLCLLRIFDGSRPVCLSRNQVVQAATEHFGLRISEELFKGRIARVDLLFLVDQYDRHRAVEHQGFKELLLPQELHLRQLALGDVADTVNVP